MRKSRINFFVILCMIFAISLIQTGLCQESAALEVLDPAICASVEDRACIDTKEEFSADIDKLYCFTRISGAAEDTEVTHVWYYGDIERARVPLAVRSSSYRTYSSKRIQSHEIGKWHVDVLGPDGSLLKTISFAVVQ
jgi:hypothetical protein